VRFPLSSRIRSSAAQRGCLLERVLAEPQQARPEQESQPLAQMVQEQRAQGGVEPLMMAFRRAHLTAADHPDAARRQA
jgi:hypothetical protein